MIAMLLAILMPRPEPLHVEGVSLVEAGKTVTLSGVQIPGFEAPDGGRFVFRSARIALEDWGANCVEIPVSEDRWFGKTALNKDKGEAYVNEVEEVMNLALNRGRYIILSLSSSDAGQWGGNLGPHHMPDDHSLQFWKDLAVKYRGEPHVLFELYDAPSGVPWDVWRDGGEVTEGDLHYHAPGMQTLLDAIRKAGSKNLCLIEGLDGGRDLSGIPAGSGLKDPGGRGVAYIAGLNGPPQDWNNKLAPACPLVPVLAKTDGASAQTAFEWIQANKLSWIATGMDVQAKPSLISDWTYTPTAWGAQVKQRLKAG